MKTFFDSSAYAKRFIEEKGSNIVEEICIQTSSLGLSIICIPEIISALNRQVRERNISQRDYKIVKKRFLDEINDTTIINTTPNVILKSIELLEKNALRTLDSLHLACAIEWKSDLFVSSDKRQISAARKSGMSVRFIEND